MRCSNCGAELANDVKFCRECGTKVSPQKKYCRECGAQLAEGAKFCSECGAKVDYKDKIRNEVSIEEEEEASIEEKDEVVVEQSHSETGRKDEIPVIRDEYRYEPQQSKQERINSSTIPNSDVLKVPQIPERKKKKNIGKWSALIAAIVVVCILIIFTAGRIEKTGFDTNQSSIEQTSDEPIVETNYTIEKGTQYAFMSDEANVYIAEAISEDIIRIESWDKALLTAKKMSLNTEIGSYKINDPENGFSWVDEDHTAFNFTFSDKNNSHVRKEASHVFTINISDTNTCKGTNYDKDIACYTYTCDDWHIYRAIPLTEKLIKIECWSRSISFGKYLFGWDWCVIDPDNNDREFEWTDDEHTSFTLNTKDPNNKSYWKKDTFVVFELEDDDYKYPTVISYLEKDASGADKTGTDKREQKNGFDSTSNEQYNLGEFVIEIPEYWEKENKIRDGIQRYAETSGKVAMLQITCFPESDPEYEVSYDGLFADNENMIKAIESSAFKEVTEYEVIDTGVVKGILYIGTIKALGYSGNGWWFAFPSESDRSWCGLLLAQSDNTEYLYYEDYMSIIDSIRKADVESEAEILDEAEKEEIDEVTVETEIEAKTETELEAPNNNAVSEENVKAVQDKLNRAGFYSGAIDGDAGKMTRNAINAFAQSVGLSANGEITDEIMNALDTYLEAIGHVNFPKEMALRAAVVAMTNSQADDVFTADGNSYDPARFHSYDDLSGFYMTVYSEGNWSPNADGSWSVTGLKLKLSGYETYLKADLKVFYDGSGYTVSNVKKIIASLNNLDSNDFSKISLEYLDPSDSNSFLYVNSGLIKNDRNNR